MTAQCAPCMGALKIFGTPWLRPRLFFRNFFSWRFVPIYPVNMRTKFEVGSFIRSWDSSGDQICGVQMQRKKRTMLRKQNGHSGSFKVIYFAVTEEPLREYIAQYSQVHSAMRAMYGCPENFRDSLTTSTANFSNFFSWRFVPIDPVNMRTKFEFGSFTRSWDNSGDQICGVQMQRKNRTMLRKQNGHSGSFKVIYFAVTEEPLREYIAQYNNCGLGCKGSEDIASEISENRHFDNPILIWRPLASEPLRISA